MCCNRSPSRSTLTLIQTHQVRGTTSSLSFVSGRNTTQSIWLNERNVRLSRHESNFVSWVLHRPRTQPMYVRPQQLVKSKLRCFGEMTFCRSGECGYTEYPVKTNYGQSNYRIDINYQGRDIDVVVLNYCLGVSKNVQSPFYDSRTVRDQKYQITLAQSRVSDISNPLTFLRDSVGTKISRLEKDYETVVE